MASSSPSSAAKTAAAAKPRLMRNPVNQTMQDVFAHSAVLRWHGAAKDRRTDVPPIETNELTSAILFGLDGQPACPVLKNHLFREGRLSIECALDLIGRATEVFRAEPNMLRVTPPYLVIGDLHGQFYDLVNLFETAGQLADGKRFLFLGDYVDRGMFGCETVFYLFALKLKYRDGLILLRGNHESREITEYFNFQEECEKKYNLTVYNAIMRAFDALPLACLIETESYGRFLCLHGGLGPSLQTIADIEGVDRFQEPPESGPFCDLLWSDPIDIDEYPQMSDEDYQTFDFLPNDARGVGWIFGKTALSKFLAANNLECLVRAHEVQQHGFYEHRFGDRARKHPYCITVFSAPNYCDMYENRGGVMEFGAEGYSFQQTAWVSHPYWLPDFMNAFDFSLTYVAENTKNIVSTILVSMIGTTDEEDDPDDPVWKSIQEKFSEVRAALDSTEKLRSQRVAIVVPKLSAGGGDHFKEARKIDRLVDMRRPKRDKPIHPKLSRKSQSMRW